MEQCPICFSEIGSPDYANFIWNDDPIVTNPSLSTIQFQGFIHQKAQHILELQQNRNKLETDLGLTLTVFTSIDTTNLFRNWDKYILELRQSTETLLTIVGMTKENYFNFDKDGNDMRPGNHQLDWIDIVDLTTHALCNFQSKGRHIEDLRHYIRSIKWQELWNYDGEHPEINQIESWHSIGAGYWGADSINFIQNIIYGTHIWNYYNPFHKGYVYVYPEGYGDINYSLLQNNGILSLEATTVSTLTASNESAGSLAIYDFNIHVGSVGTFNGITKIKLEGINLSGINNYFVLIRLKCRFTKSTLLTLSPKIYLSSFIFKDIVLATMVGTQRHIQGVGWYRIEGGKLGYDPATGAPLEFEMSQWYPFQNCELGLVDILNYEYGLSENIIEPNIIGESYISDILINDFIIAANTNSLVPSQGYGTGFWQNNSNINWKIDNIKLT